MSEFQALMICKSVHRFFARLSSDLLSVNGFLSPLGNVLILIADRRSFSFMAHDQMFCRYISVDKNGSLFIKYNQLDKDTGARKMTGSILDEYINLTMASFLLRIP